MNHKNSDFLMWLAVYMLPHVAGTLWLMFLGVGAGPAFLMTIAFYGLYRLFSIQDNWFNRRKAERDADSSRREPPNS